MAKNFKDLSEREILALAISLEEEDGRIYGDFVDGLRETYPATAQMFEEMQEQESGHRRALIDMYRQRFGDHHSADPPPGCEGLRHAPTGVAGAPAGHQRGAQAGRDHGTGNPPVL